MLKDDLPLLPAFPLAPTLAPTPAPISPTTPGPSHPLLYLPINSTNLAGASGALGAIPIYAVDLQSAEEVATFVRSVQIQAAMKQYGGIQLCQTPPIVGWDRPEETIKRVREFLND